MFRTTAASLLVLSATPAFAADGQRLFELQCKACHASPAMAPALTGVVGRKIAATGFNYSPGLKAKQGTWTEANLDAYLKSPAAFAPGSRMFVSVPSADSRAAIIQHLKALK